MTSELPIIDSDRPLRPVDAIDHDKLQRKGFAAAAVAALQRVSSSAGFVLSIEGPWGSGKTSTLAMMEQLIRAKDDQVVIVHFNPWLIGDRDSLLRQFLGSIAAAIDLTDGAGVAKKASEEILNYAKVFDFVKWVPGAEPWATIVKSVLTSAGSAAGGIADQKSRDVEGQKAKLEAALSSLDKRIYVFIDDVDRLIPLEVFETVRIIKAIGELPNIGYIVAWDPEYIRRSLAVAAVPQAAGYIDKIVQVRLPVPAISAHARLQLLNSGIATLQPESTVIRFPKQEERLQALYFRGLRELLEHPRDVTRVMNTLSVIEPGLRGEIVFADILGLAALMVRAPEVFDVLRREPDLFTSSGSSYGVTDKHKQEEHRSKMETIFAATANPAGVKRLVYHLFPAAAHASGHGIVASAVDIEGHLAAPSRLNIALSMAIGVTDVSIADARRYIVEAGKREDIESNLSLENCLGFLDMLGSVATTISADEIKDVEELCVAIARLVDKPPTSDSEDRRRFFSLPAETLAISAIRRLVVSSGSGKSNAIAFAIAGDPVALTVAAEVVSAGRATQQEEDAIVCSPSRRQRAANKLANNAIESVRAGSFWSICNPSRVLWTIMRSAPNSAKRVFKEVKLADATLDQFALHFLKHAYSSSGGQSYALPEDVAVRNIVDVHVLESHAVQRLRDKKLVYPVRAAWRSVVEKKAIYGADGADARN